MADERWTRIETDVSETRSKVDALCTQVSTLERSCERWRDVANKRLPLP